MSWKDQPWHSWMKWQQEQSTSILTSCSRDSRVGARKRLFLFVHVFETVNCVIEKPRDSIVKVLSVYFHFVFLTLCIDILGWNDNKSRWWIWHWRALDSDSLCRSQRTFTVKLGFGNYCVMIRTIYRMFGERHFNLLLCFGQLTTFTLTSFSSACRIGAMQGTHKNNNPCVCKTIV